MSTSTLTERYVHEVVRRLPADQRQDIAQELRATIADTVDGRAGADPRAAEREVLIELGDPVRYAARYTDRPAAFIGPDLYPSYVRLLRPLMAGLLPVVAVVLTVLDLLDGRGVGQALATGAGTLFSFGAQLFAAVTLLYAAADRMRRPRGMLASAATWSPEDLPEVRQGERTGTAAASLAAAAHVVLIALVFWQHTARPYRLGDGTPVEVLDPALWSGWIWPVLGGLAALAAVGVARVAAGGWTLRLAAWYTAAQALFSLPLAWVLHRQLLLNPEFLADATALWDSPDPVYDGMALLVLLGAAIGVFTAFRDARR
ncbi:HAAS signaling domain-containing protein [Streptomyces sanyensis]|uniref:HAAS signaling domain-containing protein n=1 Tax=Streptomyces sanyensis TaxID=568869 RepID=UPI003D77D13F